MHAVPFLRGERIYLRPLVEADSEGPYPTWFNDPAVCRSNMHHIFPFTVADARAYIQQTNADRHQLALAIVRNEDHLHVGNIGLLGIDYISRTAELTIVIGDKTLWGGGLAKEAARLLCDHAFLSLNLHRLSCGTFEDNVAMCRLAAYLGMVQEGRKRHAVYKLGRYLDIVEYGVLAADYLAHFDLRLRADRGKGEDG